ncbi:tape measure protein [Stutzerimonas nitrititolerans]|uniref:tape measure protein n=1 Tax=Stutzerimonas nitrititolerans TaxID=2482751 RepID=UPI00289ECB4C|nr:tape measure protein [Stutzerimonas nitrititolerans]
MAAISSFYAQIGIQTRLQDLRSVDRYLKLLESKVRKSSTILQKDFSKNFTLPALTVKKFKFDSLALQRGAQTELNRVGRLLELKVSNITLDQGRINRQVQNVFTRAASAARLNVRSIAGTSGGANANYPMHLPYVPRMPPMPHMPNTQSLGQYVGAAGLGGGLGASLPMVGGPAGLAVAGVAAAGYMGYRQVDKLNQSQTKREAQRIALDVASGSQDREGRDAMNARFLDLSNRLGLNAEKNVDAYAQAMKQLQGAGLSAPQAFKLFENVSIATKGSGLTDEQNSRQLYAITQTFGKQALMSEELNQQLGDANAGIKRFVQEVWQDRTGKSGMEAFLKDMAARKVTPDMLAEAYARQAAYVAPRVEEFAASAESSKNRLANARFSEELQRTLDDEMVPSIKRFTAAQQELHQATAPLRDGMYSLGAATLSATAGLVSWTAKTLENSPALQKQASYEQRSEAVMASSMGRGLLSVPNITRLQEQPRKLTTPQLYQKPEWRMQADQYANPESILEQLSSTTNHVSVQSSVSFQPGSFQISTQATDAQALAAELQPLIQEQFDSSLQRTLQEVDTSLGGK